MLPEYVPLEYVPIQYVPLAEREFSRLSGTFSDPAPTTAIGFNSNEVTENALASISQFDL